MGECMNINYDDLIGLTQEDRILHFLFNIKPTITQAEAWQHLGISRLASRVHDLNKTANKIESEMISVENRFGEKCRIAQYKLIN